MKRSLTLCSLLLCAALGDDATLEDVLALLGMNGSFGDRPGGGEPPMPR